MSSKKEKHKVLYPKYWASRTLIFAIIGLVPFLSGTMFLIMGFKLDEKIYKSDNYEIDAFEIIRERGQNDFEMVLKIDGHTMRDTLEYHDDWYNLLAVYGKPGIRQRVLGKENIEYAIQKVKIEKPSIKVYLNKQTKTLTGLRVDGNTIIAHYNFLLMGILFTALGIFMIGGSLYIIIRDPNDWYRNTKDISYQDNA